MHPNLKIVFAVFLVFLAAGVVAHNVQFLSGRSAEGEPESDYEADMEEWAGEESLEDGEEAGARGTGPEAMAELLQWSTAEAVAAEDQRIDGKDGRLDSGSGNHASLGEKWNDTVWGKLLDAFAQKENPHSIQASGVRESAIFTAPVGAGATAFANRVDSLKITGILRGTETSAALINGRIYPVGAPLPGLGVTVAAINKGRVVLRSEGSGITAVKYLEPRGSTLRRPVRDEEDDMESGPEDEQTDQQVKG